MLDEFKRYCSLQRDQAPLASLLIYLKRKGGFVQLNRIWKELGPRGAGAFLNQTTLINKLDKLERLEMVIKEQRILSPHRDQAKKKTNTFYRLNPISPIYPYVYGMMKIYKDEAEKYSSQLVSQPLDKLIDISCNCRYEDHLAEKELVVAMELISEVFLVGEDEAKRMIEDRMICKGLIAEQKKKSK